MKRIRLSYANIMATIAVFIALGGTSYAALKLPRNSVGAVQLKSGAVTSAKIRNATIRAADLSAGARGGPRGPRGASGPSGARGPAGMSSVIVRTRDEVAARPALTGDSYVNVISVALPAGRWIVFATTGVYSNSTTSDNFRCFIDVDGTRRGFGKVQAAGNAAGATTSADLSLMEIVDKPSAAAVALSCGHDQPLAAGVDARFDRAKVVAVPVEIADVAAVTG